MALARVGGILERISECQEIALDNHPQAGVVDRCVEFLEGFTQVGELQRVGSENGLELLTMEGTAQDSLDSDQEIEEQERHRDAQDEAGHDHCFPQSSCQFCQEYGNAHGHPDNLHCVWDTGLLQHLNRHPEALARELESRITPQDRVEWIKGTIEDWVMEGHRLAQTVAYGNLGSQSPAPITAAYERQAEPVIELQLEKAGVRLAYLLNAALK
jgi:hypothetical protein